MQQPSDHTQLNRGGRQQSVDPPPRQQGSASKKVASLLKQMNKISKRDENDAWIQYISLEELPQHDLSTFDGLMMHSFGLGPGLKHSAMKKQIITYLFRSGMGIDLRFFASVKNDMITYMDETLLEIKELEEFNQSNNDYKLIMFCLKLIQIFLDYFNKKQSKSELEAALKKLRIYPPKIAKKIKGLFMNLRRVPKKKMN